MCFSHLSKIYYTNSPHHPPLSHHWDNKLPSSSTFVPSLGQPTPPHHPLLSHPWDNQLPIIIHLCPIIGTTNSPSSSTFVPSLGQPTPNHHALLSHHWDNQLPSHHPLLSHHWDNQLPSSFTVIYHLAYGFASVSSPEAGLYVFYSLCFSTMLCIIKKQILNLRDQEFVE